MSYPRDTKTSGLLWVDKMLASGFPILIHFFPMSIDILALFMKSMPKIQGTCRFSIKWTGCNIIRLLTLMVISYVSLFVNGEPFAPHNLIEGPLLCPDLIRLMYLESTREIALPVSNKALTCCPFSWISPLGLMLSS